VILPTQPPPDPQDENPLEFLMPVFSLIFFVILLALLLIATLWGLYWWWEWRGTQGLTPIERAYARLNRYLRLAGLSFSDSQTPSERQAGLIRTLPEVEKPVRLITHLYNAERYGPPSPLSVSPNVEERVEDAWSDVRWAILRRWLRQFMFWRRD
jgi:hypothetical protein